MPKILKKTVEKYLQQQADFRWLTSSNDTSSGQRDRKGQSGKGAGSNSSSMYQVQESEQGYGDGQRDRKGQSGKGAGSNSSSMYPVQGSEQGYGDGQMVMGDSHQALYRGNSYEGEQHTFEERVVYTTFPGDLHEQDFEEYVDRKFSNLDVPVRQLMKSFFKEKKSPDIEQRIQVSEEANGSLGITLVQMLLDKDQDHNELNVSVGYIKFLANSRHSREKLGHEWQTNRDRVIRALEYKYGVNLKGELE